ncbi:putative membrane protein, partial [Plasmodium reichenowi]
YITTFNKLNVLKNNINKNNATLENEYFHTYPVLTGIGETLTTIITEGNKNFENARNVIKEVKSTIKYSFHTIDETIRNVFKDNLPKITGLITQAGKSIKGINNKYKIKERIPKYTNIILLTNVILLLPPFLILLGIIIFMIFILMGNIQKNNNFFIKLFGHFSAYFGFLTIITLSFGILFLSTSVIGGTSCILSERILKNELRFDILNNTLIDYCIKNENAPLIHDDITTSFVTKINSFDTGHIDNNINEYEKRFTILKNSFFQKSLKFMDYIWIVIMKRENNTFLNKIRNEQVKTSLLITGIINENIKYQNMQAIGIKSYLTTLNGIIFPGNIGKICFNDNICEKENNTYNITENSKTTDQKYRTIRNLISEHLRHDLDAIVELFVYKARILKEKIFDINDLDSNEKNKIGWSEYTPRNINGTQKKSIINTFLVNVIESINFSEIINFFDKMRNQFNVLKELILLKIDTLTENTKCNKLVKELIHVRKDYCNNVVLNLSTLSVYLIIFSITSFLLWYLFLFLWFYYNIKPS